MPTPHDDSLEFLDRISGFDEAYDDPHAWEQATKASLVRGERIERAYKLGVQYGGGRPRTAILVFTDRRLLHLHNDTRLGGDRDRHGLNFLGAYPYATLTDAGVGYHHKDGYAYLEVGIARKENRLRFRLGEDEDAHEIFRRLSEHMMGTGA